MKQFIRSNLKVFVVAIITAILFTGIGVYAARQYLARDISFTSNNENFKKENGETIDNVEDALNELYNKEKEIPISEIWSSVSTNIDYKHTFTQSGLYIVGIMNCNNESNRVTLNTNSKILDQKELENWTRSAKIKLISVKENDEISLKAYNGPNTYATAFIYKLNKNDISKIVNCSDLSIDTTSIATFNSTKKNEKILMLGFSCGETRNISVNFNGNTGKSVLKGLQLNKNDIYIGYAFLDSGDEVSISSFGRNWGSGVSLILQ